jgi:hypothetical protein
MYQLYGGRRRTEKKIAYVNLILLCVMLIGLFCIWKGGVCK